MGLINCFNWTAPFEDEAALCRALQLAVINLFRGATVRSGRMGPDFEHRMPDRHATDFVMQGCGDNAYCIRVAELGGDKDEIMGLAGNIGYEETVKSLRLLAAITAEQRGAKWQAEKDAIAAKFAKRAPQPVPDDDEELDDEADEDDEDLEPA